MEHITTSDDILFVWSAAASDKVEEAVNKIKEHSAGKAPQVENLDRLKLGMSCHSRPLPPPGTTH